MERKKEMKAGSSSVIYKEEGEDWRRLGVPSRKLWSWIAGVQHAMRPKRGCLDGMEYYLEKK